MIFFTSSQSYLSGRVKTCAVVAETAEIEMSLEAGMTSNHAHQHAQTPSLIELPEIKRCALVPKAAPAPRKVSP